MNSEHLYLCRYYERKVGAPERADAIYKSFATLSRRNSLRPSCQPTIKVSANDPPTAPAALRSFQIRVYSSAMLQVLSPNFRKFKYLCTCAASQLFFYVSFMLFSHCTFFAISSKGARFFFKYRVEKSVRNSTWK